MITRICIFLALILIGFKPFSAYSSTFVLSNTEKEIKVETQDYKLNKINGNCPPATSIAYLDVNNVRTAILNGGDFGWNLNEPKYEVPKTNSINKVNSIYLHSLWFGGIDAGNQLKVAAQTYRQTSALGVGFWPGPLKNNGDTIGAADCLKYDRQWKINKSEVNKHKAFTLNSNKLFPGYTPPAAFLDWPAHGNVAQGFDNYLAPFEDVNKDGKYNPYNGDYPKIRGDQAIWFVINDAGNRKETGSAPIGLEIHVQAFAMSAANDLNNATFYEYTFINKGNVRMNACYIGKYVDSDLGNASDDFLGSDVPRGLAYSYNGDDNDEGAQGYGLNPPAIGFDYVEGPFSDAFDGIDNNRNGIVDEIVSPNSCTIAQKTERISMTNFIYIGGNATPIGKITSANDVYNYMRGIWRDGTRMVYGGIGYPGSTGTFNNIPANFMFPGNSDMQIGWSIGGSYQNPKPAPAIWTETTAGNVPADRRFMMSAGPFTMQPGAVNYTTEAAIWARTNSGGAQGSLNLLLQADTKIQSMFNNCFQITIDGPDAPIMIFSEQDQLLNISLINSPNSNNKNHNYAQVDRNLSEITTDDKYRFQGYKVFQLANSQVNLAELNDTAKAKLVFQSDIKDTISNILNYYGSIEFNISIPQLMVSGKNEGIKTSFSFQNDAFTKENSAIINHKPYYFMAVAYAFNNYETYNASQQTGQNIPYFESVRDVKVYTAIPHKTESESDGLILHSKFGERLSVTRLEGQGNGGNELELTDESIAEILANGSMLHPTYKVNGSPIQVFVNNPKLVPKGSMYFGLFTGAPGSSNPIGKKSRWFVDYNGKRIFSDTAFDISNEHILYEESLNSQNQIVFNSLGISIIVNQVQEPFVTADNAMNPVISSSISFSKRGNAWLKFNEDNNIPGSFRNWMFAGINKVSGVPIGWSDSLQFLGKILKGSWAPGIFTLQNGYHPFYKYLNTIRDTFERLASVDIVFTNDKSKWTRGLVFEAGDVVANNENQQKKGLLRLHTSVDKDGNSIAGEIGRAWFPGYAINLETGERLNICFAEESWSLSGIGKDMKWNPSSQFQGDPGIEPVIVWGGKHNVYIMKSKYDEGLRNHKTMSTPNAMGVGDSLVNIVYRDVMYVSMPILAEGRTLLSCEAKVKIRIANPYKFYATSSNPQNGNMPYYRINLDKSAKENSVQIVAIDAMKTINVVPNPYFKVSNYEANNRDNRIKITNLPTKCKINIYNLNGVLIQSIEKNNSLTYEEWNLQDKSGKLIESGMYIFRIDAVGLGQKTIKWMAVMRD